MTRIFAICMAALLAACAAGGADFHTTDNYETAARPWTHLNFANDPDDFQFAIITDRTGGHRPGVFPAILKKVNLLQPEFVMSVGDYIEGYTSDKERLLAEWAEIDGWVEVIESPLFFVVGNHDIANQAMEDVWRERAERTQYHFVYKDVLFIALNTEDPRYPTPEEQAEQEKALELQQTSSEAMMEFVRQSPVLLNYMAETGPARIGDSQRDWVLGLLETNKNVRWTFVFLHRPIWDNPTPNFAAIEAALLGRGYTMFAGHNHNYVHTERQDRDYMRLGTTGGGWDDPGAPGAMDHISWVTMRDGGPVFAHLVATGILAKDKIPDFIPGAEFCGQAYNIECVFGGEPQD